MPSPAPIVAVDPVLDPADETAVRTLCTTFGRYRTYGELEPIEIPEGPGLAQRHDSVRNFLRSGGLGGAQERVGTLAARTSYFREEYAYAGELFTPAIAPFLHSERLAAAARTVHGRPVIEPQIAYANLMVPGQELAVHTDVPEFRGVSRKTVPQWLLVVMHHSGLFHAWRLHIATGIAWFSDLDGGALAYWPDGPDGELVLHPIRSNSALVLDTDSVFHGVARVAPVDRGGDARRSGRGVGWPPRATGGCCGARTATSSPTTTGPSSDCRCRGRPTASPATRRATPGGHTPTTSRSTTSSRRSAPTCRRAAASTWPATSTSVSRSSTSTSAFP